MGGAARLRRTPMRLHVRPASCAALSGPAGSAAASVTGRDERLNCVPPISACPAAPAEGPSMGRMTWHLAAHVPWVLMESRDIGGGGADCGSVLNGHCSECGVTSIICRCSHSYTASVRTLYKGRVPCGQSFFQSHNGDVEYNIRYPYLLSGG